MALGKDCQICHMVFLWPGLLLSLEKANIIISFPCYLWLELVLLQGKMWAQWGAQNSIAPRSYYWTQRTKLSPPSILQGKTPKCASQRWSPSKKSGIYFKRTLHIVIKTPELEKQEGLHPRNGVGRIPFFPLLYFLGVSGLSVPG